MPYFNLRVIRMNIPTDFELVNKRLIEAYGTLLRNGQLYVEKPLLGYKKVFTYAPRYDALMQLQGVEGVKRYTHTHAVATIVIPKGSLLNLAQNSTNKYRASQAICQSIERIFDKCMTHVARSGHSYDFYYYPVTDIRNVFVLQEQPSDQEKMKNLHRLDTSLDLENLRNRYVIKPKVHFNTSTAECASGIHFFLNKNEAEQYDRF